MDKEGAIAGIRATLAFSDDEGPWSVFPRFGMEHDNGATCWCNPTPDDIDPRILIHHPSH